MTAFILGYTIMFFNEGFVILRHVSPWFAHKRKQLHERFGRERIKRIHGFTDWSWILLIALGSGKMYDFDNAKQLIADVRAQLNDDMAPEANRCFEFAMKLFEELDR